MKEHLQRHFKTRLNRSKYHMRARRCKIAWHMVGEPSTCCIYHCTVLKQFKRCLVQNAFCLYTWHGPGLQDFDVYYILLARCCNLCNGDSCTSMMAYAWQERLASTILVPTELNLCGSMLWSYRPRWSYILESFKVKGLGFLPIEAKVGQVRVCQDAMLGRLGCVGHFLTPYTHLYFG